MLVASPAGNDLPYDEKYVEQGRNFTNKIWNAFRLLKGLETAPDGYRSTTAEAWFEARCNEALAEIEKHFEAFRISDALQGVYKLIWDDYCSWYLEMIKPPYGEPIAPEGLQQAEANLERLMKVLHPFMPFITEEVYKTLATRTEADSVCVAPYPVAAPLDGSLLQQAQLAFELIAGVRTARASRGQSPKEGLTVAAVVDDTSAYQQFKDIISKLANITVQYVAMRPEGPSDLITVKQDAFYILRNAAEVDVEGERESLQKDLDYQRGFLASVDAKLSNERFVASAKLEMVERERQKKADAEAKISTLRAALAAL
jgi:valyl-tRNA synthetase